MPVFAAGGADGGVARLRQTRDDQHGTGGVPGAGGEQHQHGRAERDGPDGVGAG
ncbi:hypothetical protein [Streptomyces roseochromogenus]|nr:hypothetical protein [Streptomyces roseochromogenus]